MKLSIIVPMLNESAELPGLIASLRGLARDGAEIIFADGGSQDDSAQVAAGNGFRVIRSPRGRATQMNAGAALATGQALLFLHADTRLPEGAARLIERALSDSRYLWGRFDVRIDGHARILRVVARMMNMRSRLTGIATGDQGMFVTRKAFDAVGGFPDQPLMEDIELSKRLLAWSRPACIAQCATTSGRRWESRGAWRTILLMWRLRWRYWRGVPAQVLAEAYR